MTDPLQLVTASRLRSFRSCKRRDAYRYGLGVRPIRQGQALRFGTLFHAGLEAWWLALQGEESDPYDCAIDALRSSIVLADGELDEFDLARAEELLAGYSLRWNTGHSGTVLAVEAEFRAPLINPETGAPSRTYQLGGKIDAIVRDEIGDVYIVEHKTTTMDASPGSEYWRRLRIDGQISMYFEGAAALGHDVAGCIYDVIVRPTIKPYKATPIDKRKYTTKPSKLRDGTTRPAGSLHANMREHDETPDDFRLRVRAAIAADPDHYFVRGTVVRLEDEMIDHRFDVWNTAKHMRAVQLSGRTVRNPDACVQFNRTCEYFEVCCGEQSLDDESVFVRRASTHPELSTQAKEEPQPHDPINALSTVF